MTRSARLQLLLTCAVAVGCGGRGGSYLLKRDAGIARDAGARDTGVIDAGQVPRDAGFWDGGGGPGPRDAGFRDGGLRDAGFRDAGPRPDAGPGCGDGVCDLSVESAGTCPQDCASPTACAGPGGEGCRCNSTFVDGDPAFSQDDCGLGMVCVPWDTLSGRSFELTGPLQSCVRPCITDADCGTNANGGRRRCVDGADHPNSSAPVGRICVDHVVPHDGYCGPSRNATPRLGGVQLRTPRVMVGCAADAQCAFGAFDDIHPDEGVCLQYCGRPGDPACPAEVPYCNPSVFTETAPNGTPVDVGVCSVGRLGVGSWCSPDLPYRVGLSELCDTSPATPGDVVCVGLGLTYSLCMELCMTPGMPCQTVDPTNGSLYCVEGLLTSGGGICMTPDCGTFPDSCPGPGGLNNGRECLALTQDQDGICTDRRAPVLAPGIVDSSGMLVAGGDDCQATDMAFTQCPDGTSCFGTASGGTCLAGCSRAANADPTYCSNLLPALGLPSVTATCAQVQPFSDPTIGLCGGD